MKRKLLGGLSLAGSVLTMTLVGCGPAGLEEGVPADTKNVAPLPADFTSMHGRTVKDMAKAAAKSRAETKAAGTAAPTTEPPK
jgi:hypothetical protein